MELIYETGSCSLSNGGVIEALAVGDNHSYRNHKIFDWSVQDNLRRRKSINTSKIHDANRLMALKNPCSLN